MTLRRVTQRRGFSLVEVLVAAAIFLILLLSLAKLVDLVQKSWRSTTSQIEQFQSARDAFQSLTDHLSLATLNTFWGYDSATNPQHYTRQSELRFRSDSSATLLTGTESNTVSHAVFFLAPLNYQDSSTYVGLEKLLNTWGYFIQFAGDTQDRPPFLSTLINSPPPRYRFRLMEMAGSPEDVTVYNYTSGATNGVSNSIGYTQTSWFTDVLTNHPESVRVLAENIIALVILPKLAPEDDPSGTLLAPNYAYDSAQSQSTNAQLNSLNQLPPTLQITLFAVDETSYSRFQERYGTSAPPANVFGLDNLFQNSANYLKDVQTLESNLQAVNLNYRVFSSNVSVKGARWSTDQSSN